MFRRSHRATAQCVIAAPRVSTVRVLATPEDLRAAIERAREFERMRAGHGAPILRYERYLHTGAGDQNLADVMLAGSEAVGA